MGRGEEPREGGGEEPKAASLSLPSHRASLSLSSHRASLSPSSRQAPTVSRGQPLEGASQRHEGFSHTTTMGTRPTQSTKVRHTPRRSVPRYVSPFVGARYPVQSGQVGAGRTAQERCFLGSLRPVRGCVEPSITLSEAACRWRHVRVLEVKIYYLQPTALATEGEGQQYTTTTASHTPRWPAPSAPHTARPNLPFPTLASSASKSSRRTSLLQRMQRHPPRQRPGRLADLHAQPCPHSPPAWIDQLTAPPAPTTACRVMKHDR